LRAKVKIGGRLRMPGWRAALRSSACRWRAIALAAYAAPGRVSCPRAAYGAAPSARDLRGNILAPPIPKPGAPFDSRAILDRFDALAGRGRCVRSVRRRGWHGVGFRRRRTG
jgi:hypothetical protein